MAAQPPTRLESSEKTDMDFTDHNITVIVGLQVLQEFLRACQDSEAGLESRPTTCHYKRQKGLARLCTHTSCHHALHTVGTASICCAYINADQGKIVNSSQSPCPRIYSTYPKSFLKNILVLLCRENAQSIQTCRHTRRMLKPTIAQSTFVQYRDLERPSLYNPQLLIGDGSGSVTACIPISTLALPDRMATLQAWEEAWNALGGTDR